MYRVIVNTSEEDVMHTITYILNNVERVASVDLNNITVLIVLECPNLKTAQIQASLYWDEKIPAAIVSSDEQEVITINNLLETIKTEQHL